MSVVGIALGWAGEARVDVMLSSWLLPVYSMVMAIAFVRSSSTSPAENACLVCSPGEYCADTH